MNIIKCFNGIAIRALATMILLNMTGSCLADDYKMNKMIGIISKVKVVNLRNTGKDMVVQLLFKDKNSSDYVVKPQEILTKEIPLSADFGTAHELKGVKISSPRGIKSSSKTIPITKLGTSVNFEPTIQDRSITLTIVIRESDTLKDHWRLVYKYQHRFQLSATGPITSDANKKEFELLNNYPEHLDTPWIMIQED